MPFTRLLERPFSTVNSLSLSALPQSIRIRMDRKILIFINNYFSECENILKSTLFYASAQNIEINGRPPATERRRTAIAGAPSDDYKIMLKKAA